MDPDQALNELIDCIIANDMDGAEAVLSDLAEWTARGGFLPVDPRKQKGAS